MNKRPRNAEIRRIHMAGERSVAEIADLFGLTRQQICRILGRVKQ